MCVCACVCESVCVRVCVCVCVHRMYTKYYCYYYNRIDMGILPRLLVYALLIRNSRLVPGLEFSVPAAGRGT